MRKGENYNTGVTPNLRPKNKKNSKARVKRAAEVVAFLNKAAKDENKLLNLILNKRRDAI